MKVLRTALELFTNYELEARKDGKSVVADAAKAELAALEAVAEAARTGKGLDDALDALDALKGAE